MYFANFVSFGIVIIHPRFVDYHYGTSKAAPWRAGAIENTTIETTMPGDRSITARPGTCLKKTQVDAYRYAFNSDSFCEYWQNMQQAAEGKDVSGF